MLEVSLTIIYLVIFTIIIRKNSFFSTPNFSKNTISFVFILKVFSGVILSWVYSHYYADRATADIFKYFDDSQVMYEALFSKPIDFLQMFFGIANDNVYFDENYYSKMNHWFRPFASGYNNDTHSIIRFNAFVRIFSFGNYNVHTVFINFLSFSGLMAFYKLFSNHSPVSKKLLFYGIFLIPSLLFWGSGVLKEGLLLFVIGFFCQSIFSLIHQPFKTIKLIAALLLSYFLIRLKFYVLIALIPPIIAYVWVVKFNNTKAFAKHIVTVLLLLGLALNLKFIAPQYNPIELIAQKQKDFICLAEFMNSGSKIALTPLKSSTESFLSLIPEGLRNVLLRPYLWENNSLFTMVCALENAMLLLLLITAIVFSKKKSEINWSLLAFSVVFVLSLYTIIGITTPVLGAMVRYKIPALPFLILSISLFIDPQKISQKIPLLRKYICD